MTTPLQRARQTDTRNLSQEDIAEGVGLTQSYYSRVERGVCQPTPEIAEKLAKFLGGRISEMEILYPERFVAETGEAA